MWNGTSFAANGSCAARSNAWRKKLLRTRHSWVSSRLASNVDRWVQKRSRQSRQLFLANCTGWSRNIHIAHFASVCRANIMSTLGLRVSTNVGNGEDCGSTEHLSHDSTWPTWPAVRATNLWQETFPVLSSTFHCLSLRGKMIVPPCSSQTDLDFTKMAPLTMPSRG